MSTLEKIDYGLKPRYPHVHTDASGTTMPGAADDVLIAHVGSQDIYASPRFGIVRRHGSHPGHWVSNGDIDRLALPAAGALAIFTTSVLTVEAKS